MIKVIHIKRMFKKNSKKTVFAKLIGTKNFFFTIKIKLMFISG